MILKDKVAIITGSSRGIGRAIALEFAREGADVVVVCRTAGESANEVADKIRGIGRRAIVVKADVGKREQTVDLINATLKEFGKIDILVNNAGPTADVLRRFWETTDEQWNEMIETHLKGMVYCTRAVISHMKERESGKIINVTSAAALMGAPQLSAYGAVKGAVISLTKTLARELARYRINVNAIAPQAETQALEEFKKNPRYWEETLKMYLLGLPKPEDIAPAFAFLASNGSDYITGQILNVDGGFYIG